jgi:hypothetical protein
MWQKFQRGGAFAHGGKYAGGRGVHEHRRADRAPAATGIQSGADDDVTGAHSSLFGGSQGEVRGLDAGRTPEQQSAHHP